MGSGLKRKRLSDSGVKAQVVEVQLPKHTLYPSETILESNLSDIEDILKGDSIAIRLAELGKAIWEIHGILTCWKWGNPDVPGSCPAFNGALSPKLQEVSKLLAAVKNRVSHSFTMSQTAFQTSSGSADDINEQVVLLDCGLRTIKLLLTAINRSRLTGTPDSMIN